VRGFRGTLDFDESFGAAKSRACRVDGSSGSGRFGTPASCTEGGATEGFVGATELAGGGEISRAGRTFGGAAEGEDSVGTSALRGGLGGGACCGELPLECSVALSRICSIEGVAGSSETSTTMGDSGVFFGASAEGALLDRTGRGGGTLASPLLFARRGGGGGGGGGGTLRDIGADGADAVGADVRGGGGGGVADIGGPGLLLRGTGGGALGPAAPERRGGAGGIPESCFSSAIEVSATLPTEWVPGKGH
jgi:hypothetical protein